MAPYLWTIREGSTDGPIIKAGHFIDTPGKEPIAGDLLHLGELGEWRVIDWQKVPDDPQGSGNVLVVERVLN